MGNIFVELWGVIYGLFQNGSDVVDVFAELLAYSHECLICL